jgi:hypothetical protein
MIINFKERLLTFFQTEHQTLCDKINKSSHVTEEELHLIESETIKLLHQTLTTIPDYEFTSYGTMEEWKHFCSQVKVDE